jgi:hypothetical protein
MDQIKNLERLNPALGRSEEINFILIEFPSHKTTSPRLTYAFSPALAKNSPHSPNGILLLPFMGASRKEAY